MPIDVGKVGMIPLDKVIVGDRARKVMGDLSGTEEDMRRSGLISPLTVKDNHNGTFTLLAGGRRFQILQRNNNTEFPARIYDRELSELEMKIIEKSENFHRKDFEHWELDALTLEIHRLHQKVHGTATPGPSGGWSAKDTAELIGGTSKPSVVKSIRRAEAREMAPELFEKCKTASDADKVIKKMTEAVVKEAIAQKLETSKTKGTLHELASRFIIKDCFEGIKEIPAGIMHLVEIDPPYAITLTEQKKKDGESKYTLDDYNEIDKEDYREFMFSLFRECYRVMTDHSWLICWFAPEPWFETIYNGIISAGFQTTRMCGIWPKGSGQNMNPQTRLANTYEMFFYAWKGTPVLNRAGHGNEFRCPPVPPQQKSHPTERPVELMKEIYDTFAFKGSRILIPFLGSGNGIIAAHELGMTAVGFELSKSFKDSFLVKVHGMK